MVETILIGAWELKFSEFWGLEKVVEDPEKFDVGLGKVAVVSVWVAAWEKLPPIQKKSLSW